ncbi:hypothetical protein COCOBI_17-3140 [Coccomyxa sp. Obi]|nr:hypothetical protein COCOBI_17-3140 [Coccomyxa sp. Obi]
MMCMGCCRAAGNAGAGGTAKPATSRGNELDEERKRLADLEAAVKEQAAKMDELRRDNETLRGYQSLLDFLLTFS